ncbi:MAG: hypothetical protein QOH88_1171 [Verrucomicrobiota bacterium]
MKSRSQPVRTRRRASALCVIAFSAAVFFGLSERSPAQTQDNAYYWVVPRLRPDNTLRQSFVIEVNASQASQIEAIRALRHSAGISGQIAAGSVDYNKDYYSSDQHVWKWHFSSIDQVFDFSETFFIACMCPPLIANPSDIEADPAKWIQDNGNRYTPTGYEIAARIDPTRRDAMANVSNRGVTGAGDKTLITGLIITGGVPRNVVVRGLGPSLTALGLKGVAGNPKIAVFQGAQNIATNADWKTDARAAELGQKYPSLAPGDDKEAAQLLTLLPGSYTIQGTNEDGSEGIMLIEAYDVDSLNP